MEEKRIGTVEIVVLTDKNRTTIRDVGWKIIRKSQQL